MTVAGVEMRTDVAGRMPVAEKRERNRSHCWTKTLQAR
jgi:hypothetical protein